MRSDRSVPRRVPRSLSVRLARAGSAAALALLVVTCHSDKTVNTCNVAALAFTTQPGTTAAGSIIPVTVAVRDNAGNTLACSSADVTISLGTNPGGATLNGTATVTAASGVATFNSLNLTKAANGYTFTASVGNVSVTSTAFNINPGPASALAFTTQPSTVAAGAAISAVVTARDQFGNPATSFVSSVTMAIGNNPGGATLGGTTAVTATGGVANFTNLLIGKVGTGYTLTATPTAGAPPAGVTSAAFNVNPGPTTQLVFTTPPAGGSAGSPLPAIVVTAQDAQGNTTPAFTGPVTLAFVANPGAGTLSGGGPIAAVAGVATFNAVSINRPGVGYTLSASSGALTSPTSGAFTITTGPLAKLVFTVQPTSATAGVAIAPAVTVTGQDAADNTVTTFAGNVTVAIGTNAGGGTLSGTATQAATAGVATFTDLSIDKAGVGYTLAASSGVVTPVVSSAFTINPAAAAKLSFTVQPSLTAAGSAITPAVKVTALDQFDNVATSFAGNVTVAIGTNANAGTLSGTTTIGAAAGVATFSTLSIDSAGTGYTLTATTASLTDGVSSTFNIIPGAATHLVFTQQPTTATAGAAIAPAVKVTALDAKGNVATAYAANVTVAIGTNAGGGTLSGTATIAAVNGVATFPGLNINKSGTGYTLTTTSGALTGATSAAFNINAGAATKLVFAVQPVNTAAGAPVTPSIQVAAQDALGNTDLTYTANVSLAIGNNAGGGTLTGGGPVAAVAGVATFAASIDKVGSGYTLAASSGALTGATSAAFDIFANLATHLIFFVQPSNAVAGVAIAPAVVVHALDASDNVATGFTGGITVAIGNNAGGGTLSGTASVTAVAGVATFANLSIDKTGDGYTLATSAGGVTGIASTGFKITPAAATHLVFSQQPVNGVAGVAIPVTVRALDTFDNIDTAYTANIDVSIGTNAGGGTLSGTTPIAAVHGAAAFGNLSINKTGTGYTLHATSGTLTDVNSSAFNIAPAPLSQLVFTAPPTNVVAGAVIQPDVVVQGQDAFANTVTSFVGSVSIAIGTNAGGGTLGGTTAVNAIAGVATFSNLTINKAGSGYTLVASATGAPDVTSVGFDVTAGAATKLAFTVQPAASTTAGSTISSPITVAAQDALGNTVAGFTGDITIALAGGKAGATLSGTKVITPTNGLAVFSNLSVDSAGTGYSLVASATGLTDGSSNTFTITAGAATKLAFTVNPVTTVAGQTIPTIQVNAQDALGNTDPSYTASVGVAITGGTGKAGAALTGTASHAAVAGVASFPGLSIDSAGTAYTLTATSGGLTNGVSASFNISAGTVTQLLFTQQPTTAQAGAAIAPTVTVVAKDAIGNINTGYTSVVTLTLSTNPGGATPSNAAVAANAGVATFPGLFLDKVGTGYRLQASDGSVTSAQSTTFNITPGTASQLVFIVEPSTVNVGANIFPSVKVAAQDAFGNLVTSFANNIVMSLATNPGAATLTGTTRAAVSGVATFSTLTVSVAANGYRLGAAAPGLTSATSTFFDVLPATATALFFRVQPSSAAAGAAISPDITVEARNASGQVDGSFTGSVTIAITPNTGAPGATITAGTTTLNAVAGTATFTGITLDKAASNYKLTATSGTLTPAVSGFFAINPGAADHLAYRVQPSNATALSPITPQIEVTALDAFGNVANYTGNVTMSINANPGSGTLGGTKTKAAAAGVATFSDLSINNAGVGYTLDATASPTLATSSTVTSNAFDITVSTSNHLVFASQPTSTAADQAIPTFTVEARDASNSLLTGFTGNVTVFITAGTGTNGATLIGTTTQAAVGGVATFSGLKIDKKGVNYRLSVVASGLAGATSNQFTITAGTAAQVAFNQDPTNTNAGAPISPAVTVDVEDIFGNRVTTFVGNVTITIAVNQGGGTLSGTTTQPVSNGVATFGDLSIDAAGDGYRLGASSGALAGDVSQAFKITGGAADHLVFTVSPSDAVAGVGITPDVKVTAFDALGNVATGFTGNVIVAITSGTGTVGATLSGTTTVAAVAGVATFAGLSVDKVGTGYTLSATSSVTGATSGTFAISPAAADHLIFSVQPSNTAANAAITPPVVVTAVDAFNNVATGYAGTITVAMGTNAGGAGSVLSGTKVHAAVAGVATFNDLSINNTGTGYTLTAVGTSPALALIGSAAFNIN
ncbi:MAG TPA: hypothetical protein VKP10_19735 [Gemmatimonadales bacterium]|nr:hypothetical protein [Gemmatimonadales bacterium]